MEQEPTLLTKEAPAAKEQHEKRKFATTATDFDKLSNGKAKQIASGGELPANGHKIRN